MGLTAFMINEPRPFVQIFNLLLTEGFRGNLKKIGPGVSEKKLLKGVNGRTRVDGRTTNEV